MQVDSENKDVIQSSQLQITCAACQEACEVEKYWEKPFVQLGYSAPTKLLYHSYRQTFADQKQGLENLRLAA